MSRSVKLKLENNVCKSPLADRGLDSQVLQTICHSAQLGDIIMECNDDMNCLRAVCGIHGRNARGGGVVLATMFGSRRMGLTMGLK